MFSRILNFIEEPHVNVIFSWTEGRSAESSTNRAQRLLLQANELPCGFMTSRALCGKHGTKTLELETHSL